MADFHLFFLLAVSTFLLAFGQGHQLHPLEIEKLNPFWLPTRIIPFMVNASS
jgi:hypothetical protein